MLAGRFALRDDHTWLDVATGESVAVSSEPLGAEWPARREACTREWLEGSRTLIDWGTEGMTTCFVVRGLDVEGVAGADSWMSALASGLDRRDAPGVHYVSLSTRLEGAWLRRRLATRLRAEGYAPVRPTALGFDAALSLLRQPVALLICNACEVGPGLRWLHGLARVSCGPHLAVGFREPRDPVGAHDRQTGPRRPAHRRGDSDTLDSTHRSSTERLCRATAAIGRRRWREAERWQRAALESARRHGNVRGQESALHVLVDTLLDRGATAQARRVAREVAERLEGTEGWAAAAAAWARALTVDAVCPHAEALLVTAATDAALREAAVLPDVWQATGWLRFWQGRFEDACIAGERGGGPAGTRLQGLAAWAVRDVGRLRKAAGSLADQGDALWAHVFTSAATALASGDVDVSVAAARTILIAAVRPPTAHVGRLARAVAADLLVNAHRHDEVQRTIGPRPTWFRASVVEQWLARWLRLPAHSTERVHLRARLSRLGVAGIFRFGAGRQTMQVTLAVPALLQLVQDAEDELSALTACCSWVHRTCEAFGVAILDADALAFVAGDGWRREDTVQAGLSSETIGDGMTTSQAGQVLITLPIRRLGNVIGWLVIRGASERAPVLREIGRLAAVVSAPALQARLDGIALQRRTTALTPEILGQSGAMASLRDAVARAAGTPFPVLVEGESGTGKELVARAIHRLGARQERRFCAVNCAALTDDLLEAELFGHTRGAFTGAVNPRIGLFEEASGGSLFLDEVGELSPRAQAKLLRVLQEREVRRLGENSARRVDVRVIAATNQPLAEAVGRGNFRADLLFRLAVIRIRVPALRERLEDIPVLARAFWRTLSADAGRHVVLGPDALAALCRHAWPGNVRELQNVMAALLVVSPICGRLTARHVRQVITQQADEAEAAPLHRLRLQLERRAIAVALARHGGRRAPAARELGLTRQGLVKAIRRVGLGESDAAGVA